MLDVERYNTLPTDKFVVQESLANDENHHNTIMIQLLAAIKERRKRSFVRITHIHHTKTSETLNILTTTDHIIIIIIGKAPPPPHPLCLSLSLSLSFAL